MRILVTGSSGFIGKRLVHKLLDEGFTVRGLDIKPLYIKHPDYRDTQVDFTDLHKTLDVFRVVGPDLCFHLGAVADLNYARENPVETVEINVMGTANIAEACRRDGVELEYVSTCCVYGDTPAHPTAEDDLKLPTEIYGCTKLAGEYVVEGFHSLYGLEYNILRPSTVYGPGMRPALAAYIFLEHALKHKPMPIHGSGRQSRCFIYIDDLIDAFIGVIDEDLLNETVNLAGKEKTSVLDLARRCCEAVGTNCPLDFVADRPGQVMNEHIDIGKAARVLQWKPATTLDEGLKEAANWLRSCSH